MIEVGDRPADRGSERRADRDDDLGGVVTNAGRHPAPTTIGLRTTSLAEQLPRRDDLRQRLEELPALALEPVARPGSGVRVRVVHGRMDDAVGGDDRGRLQVVGGHALALHPEHRLGNVREPARGRARE